MNLSLKIAKKYFFSRKKSGSFNAVTLISGISLMGYSVGTCALIIILSVFNGFENMFAKMYSNFDAELQVTSVNSKTFNNPRIDFTKTDQMNEIAQVSFVLEENVLLKYNGKETIATAKAVDENYLKVSKVDTCVKIGDCLLQNGDTNFALCGEGLAYQLGVDPSDQFNFLSIYAPRKGEIDLLNPSNAFNKSYIIPSGVFAIQPDIDSKYILVPLRYLRNLLEKPNEASAIEIKLNDGVDALKIKKKIEEFLGKNYIVKTRFEQREAFYKLVKTEKIMSYMIVLFILIIAIFNTIGTLYLLVMEKIKEISVLHSLGFSSVNIAHIFLWQSMFIAFVGGFIGIVVGFFISTFQKTLGILKVSPDSDIPYPISFRIEDALLVFTTMMILGLITSIYPWIKAYTIAQNRLKIYK